MDDYFPKWMMDTKQQIQETQRIPNRTKKTPTLHLSISHSNCRNTKAKKILKKAKMEVGVWSTLHIKEQS